MSVRRRHDRDSGRCHAQFQSGGGNTLLILGILIVAGKGRLWTGIVGVVLMLPTLANFGVVPDNKKKIQDAAV